jgi:hypothetical protein
VTPQIASIKENAAAVANSLIQMETQVRQVINGAGAKTIEFPFYLNFGREMWKLVRNGRSGEALAVEAAVLIAKWKARGLTEAVLQGIRTDVFNIGAPITP